MIGPLPPIYRWRTTTIAVLVFIGVGAWLAYSTSVPLVAAGGALIGAVAGILATYLLLHDFSHRAQPVRVRHRR